MAIDAGVLIAALRDCGLPLLILPAGIGTAFILNRLARRRFPGRGSERRSRLEILLGGSTTFACAGLTATVVCRLPSGCWRLYELNCEPYASHFTVFVVAGMIAAAAAAWALFRAP